MATAGRFVERRRVIKPAEPIANYARQQALLNASLAAASVFESATGVSQPLDADLTEFAALSPADGEVLQRVAGVWKSTSPDDLKVSMELDEVDNTSDADKPISDLTQVALDGKLEWSAVPATSSEPASAGSIAFDADYLYVAVSVNTWKRVALTTW